MPKQRNVEHCSPLDLTIGKIEMQLHQVFKLRTENLCCGQVLRSNAG